MIDPNIVSMFTNVGGSLGPTVMSAGAAAVGIWLGCITIAKAFKMLKGTISESRMRDLTWGQYAGQVQEGGGGGWAATGGAWEKGNQAMYAERDAAHEEALSMGENDNEGRDPDWRDYEEAPTYEPYDALADTDRGDDDSGGHFEKSDTASQDAAASSYLARYKS